MAQIPLVGQNLLVIEASRSHSDTSHSVELLWTSDQLVAETTDNTQHSQQIDIQAPGGIRAHNLSRRAAVDQRLRPRGHSYRSIGLKRIINYKRYKKMRQFSWSDIPREASLDPEDDGTALCLNVSDYQSKRHNGRAYWPNPHREAIQDECF